MDNRKRKADGKRKAEPLLRCLAFYDLNLGCDESCIIEFLQQQRKRFRIGVICLDFFTKSVFIGGEYRVAGIRRVVPFGYTAIGTLILTELGALFIRPYMSASYTEVYYILRRGISGFPFNGFGVPEVENVYQQQMYQDGRYNGGLNGGDDGQSGGWDQEPRDDDTR